MRGTITIDGVSFEVTISHEQLDAILDSPPPTPTPATAPEPAPARKPFAFDSDEKCVISTWHSACPLVIGSGLAPDGDEGKCLFLHTGHDFEVTEYNGRQVITIY